MMVMATTDIYNTNNYAQCLTTLTTVNNNLSRILTTEAIITKAIIAYTCLTRFND